MTDIPLSDRIVVSREVMHGSPRIAGTRINVVQVLDLLAVGITPSEIMSDDYFPALTGANLRACIAYASQIIRDDRIVPAR
jgi:uncharacterized protein (DUF433 family)